MGVLKNLALGYVATAPSPAGSGTSLILDTGEGARFPQPSTDGSFYITVCPADEDPHLGNSEICLVTARTDDTLTITREQKSTSARTVIIGDRVIQGIYAEDLPQNGWIEANEEWTYASADDPTYTITVPSGATSLYNVGDRIKLTNDSSVKYFIVTAVADELLTVYGGTDYDLVDSAISSIYYSHQKSPVGFPLSPAKWTVIATDTGNRSQASPTQNVWYNLGSFTLSIPIGVWKVRYNVCAQATDATVGEYGIRTTLSTANNSESDPILSNFNGGYNMTSAVIGLRAMSAKEKIITLASKTSYYLNTAASSPNTDNIYNRNDVVTGIIEAICAYL